MRLSDYWTDGAHRVAFYYEHGFIPAMPTPTQIRVGMSSLAVPNKLRQWIRTIARQLRDRSFARQVVRHGSGLYMDRAAVSATYEGFDRLPVYKRLLSVPAVRGPVLALLCPEYVFAGRGLHIGTNLIVNHLLYLPHIGIGPVWDLQLVTPDPGGLDRLEERLAIARAGRGLRGRLYRLVGEAGGDVEVWYPTLESLIPACRRLEFPESHHEPTLVEFLYRCAELEPRDYEYFRTRSVVKPHPRIGWPRSPLPPPPRRAPEAKSPADAPNLRPEQRRRGTGPSFATPRA
jgi:hypothetical protein